MQYAYKDEDFLYSFDFKINGNFVVPDNGAYDYTVRNMAGRILLSGSYPTNEEEPIQPDDEETVEEEFQDEVAEQNEDMEDTPSVSEPNEDDSEDSDGDGDGEDEPEEDPNATPEYKDAGTILIPASVNTIKNEEDLFRGRIIDIKFSVKGKPYMIRDSYRVVRFFYFNASPKDVRDYYGLNEGELPDEDIDLVEIYLQLVKKHGDTFTDALKAPGIASIRANRLIVLKSVVQNFTSVRLRVNQEENDGSSKFIRYLNKIDWDALLAAAQSEIEELENDLTGDGNVSYTDYNPFFLGAVTDAITGEES